MRMTRVIVLGTLLSATPLQAQSAADTLTPQARTSASASTARPLTPAAYEGWNSIQNATLSNDGRWAVYTLAPYLGEGEIVVRSMRGATEYRASRGYISRPVYEAAAGPARAAATFRAAAPTITADSRWVLFTIEPPRAEFEKARLEKAKPADRPKASLGIMDLRTGAVTTIPRVRSFRVPREAGAVVAYLLEPDPEKPDSAAGAEAKPEREQPVSPDSARDSKETGSTLVLRELASGDEVTIHDVIAYAFADAGTAVGYTTSTKNGAGDGAYMRPLTGRLRDAPSTTLATGAGRYRGLTFDRAGKRVAFLTDRDEYARDKDKARFALYYADVAEGPSAARAVVTSNDAGGGLVVAANGDVRFARDGAALLFGVSPLPVELLPADSLADRAVFDLWHYRDAFLQPTQQLNAEQLRQPWYTAAYWPDSGSWVRLGDDEAPDVQLAEANARVGLAVSVAPYLIQGMWGDLKYDVYVVDARSGERRLVKRALEPTGGPVPMPTRSNAPFALQLSPGGKYVLFYENRHWFSHDIASGRTVDLTGSMDVAFYNELGDHPAVPNAYGAAGWTPGDTRVLIYDRYDVWEFDPSAAQPPRNITGGAGRQARITFRVIDLDRDPSTFQRREPQDPYLDPSRPLLLGAVDEETMASGVYRARIGRTTPPQKLFMADRSVRVLTRARDAEQYLVTQQSFREFPDLWAGNAFDRLTRISDANPQQSEYRWGSAQLVSFTSTNGVPLKAVLYKPDDFDPSKKYPMIVHFYERMSQQLHNYTAPAPSRASINITSYVSNGYLVLTPDIVYTDGQPGQSAVAAVVPATLAIVDSGYVDRNAIGIEGFSWGGYQTAYIVTQTDIFKAGGAGTAVANMSSAYGGIRWGAGVNRSMQYERTQSRIGFTPWERPDLYIENSPLFHLDRVATPLIVMHNDQDGAVPWYQGIELYIGLRRLGKEIYLFNYNNDDHGLTKTANAFDWDVRLQQFFDHHLKGAPKPEWMENGIPFIRKGRDQVAPAIADRVSSSR